MRRLAMVALVALLASASASETGVVFRSPAQAMGDLSVEGSTWLLLLVDPASGGLEFTASLDAGRQTNYTQVQPYARAVPVYGGGLPGRSLDPAHAPLDAMQLQLSPATGPGWLYIQAESIQFNASSHASLKRVGADDCRLLLVNDSLRDAFPFRHGLCAHQDEVGLSLGWVTGSFDVHGLHSMELYSLHTACNRDECPPGGGAHGAGQDAGPSAIQVVTRSWIELLAPGEAAGAATGFAFLGGPSVELALDGVARLPLAACHAICSSEASTLVVAGQLLLSGLSPSQSGLKAELSGNIIASRSDEKAIDWLAGATAAAGAFGLFALLRVLLSFGLLRVNPKEALDHPNRQRIHHYVATHPGATFNEVRRAAQLAVGPTRHHLTIMARGGWLRAVESGNTLRYFPGAHVPADWAQLVALRDADLARLHGWLEQNQGCTQSAIVAAADSWGWKRATAQYRLKKLVEAGVVRRLRSGRSNTYFTAQPAQPMIGTNGLAPMPTETVS